MMNLKNLWFLVSLLLAGSFCAAEISTFDDLYLETESFWNGSDYSGGFTSGSAFFSNNFTDWGGGVTSWDGFAYSNITDTLATGYASQYNAITGIGQADSQNYAVGYIGFAEPPQITLNIPSVVDGFYVTNNNYAYYTIRDGDSIFGIDPFSDGDWFLLTIKGIDTDGLEVGSVDVYLADFRYGKSEILDTWKYVDLSGLGQVAGLQFCMSSSDVGEWGMNTPGYFVIDTMIPEPASLILLGLGAFIATKSRRVKS